MKKYSLGVLGGLQKRWKILFLAQEFAHFGTGSSSTIKNNFAGSISSLAGSSSSLL